MAPHGGNPRTNVSAVGRSDYERLYGKGMETYYYDKLDRLIGTDYIPHAYFSTIDLQ